MNEKLTRILEEAPWGQSPNMPKMLQPTLGNQLTDYGMAALVNYFIENGERIFEIKKDCFNCRYLKDYSYSGNWICERNPDRNLFEMEENWDKDCVYVISETHFNYSMVPEMGETYFLTLEKAEKKLKEVKENGK